MKEEFEKLAAAGKIEGRHVEPLTQLAEGGCCTHRSWGFGRIKTVDTVFARFTIDFPGKPGHTMDLSFAADNLKPIPKDHILARKAADIGKRAPPRRASSGFDQAGFEQLWRQGHGGSNPSRAHAGCHPRRLEKMVGNRQARNEEGRPFHRADEKDRAGGFSGAGNVVAGPHARGFPRGQGFEGARFWSSPKSIKMVSDLTDKKAAAGEIITALNADIASYLRTQPAVALEAVFARDELAEAAGLQPTTVEITAAQIWGQDIKFGPMLELIPAAKHHRALASFKRRIPTAGRKFCAAR